MKKYKSLDIYTISLEGRQLIEASAGTGKTWTIAGLYLRLLLETDISLDKILVVTFTKAATAELRDRLRQRISDMLQAFESGYSEDEFCQNILNNTNEKVRPKKVDKLRECLRRFDEASIYTIHGFCQRVLTEAQTPAMLGTPEIVSDDRKWLPTLLQAAWIKHCSSPLVSDLLRESAINWDVLQRDLSLLSVKPFLEMVKMPVVSADALIKMKKALEKSWKENESEIEDDIKNANGLSGAKDMYSLINIDAYLESLKEWLLNDGALNADVKMLTPRSFEVKRKQKGSIPEHSFWRSLEHYIDQADIFLINFRESIINDVRQSLQKTKKERGLISYQDLLQLVDDAVQNPAMVENIYQQYQVALIDEFQDTDPIQFSIFDKLYPSKKGRTLFMVGDPKQAIYSFRGADIETYIRARGTASSCYTLDTNRRSLPTLVAAVNGLFSHHKFPFMKSSISFEPVKAVDLEKEFSMKEPPFHCWLLLSAQGSKKSATKDEAAKYSVKLTVSEIVRLLNEAKEGRLTIGDSPVKPRDIAVLVPKHAYGEMVVKALTKAGVSSVIRSQKSVFHTQEATDMLLLLQAVAEPGNTGVVKAASLSRLLDGSLEALNDMQLNEEKWSLHIETLVTLRDVWKKEGFMPMWEKLLLEFRVFDHILRLPDRERLLTNLRHLATLLQQQSDQDAIPERQLAWFSQQVGSEETTDDSQLKLESDAERVQVLTIHVSKGLEYPIVFCPFLWDGTIERKDDKLRAECQRGAGSFLDFGSEQFEMAQNSMFTERMEERLRVLYVALTRAKYRLYGVWGQIKDADTAAFTWLLSGGETSSKKNDNKNNDLSYSAIKDKIKSESEDDFYQKAFANFQKANKAVFSYSSKLDNNDEDLNPSENQVENPILCDVPSFSRHLSTKWRVGSFTGLSKGAQTTVKHIEEPERDDHILEVSNNEAQHLEGAHELPRGSQAGEFWHAIFEDCLSGKENCRDTAILKNAKKYQQRYDDEIFLKKVRYYLDKWLDSPFDKEGACLAKITELQAEMEFIYPVKTLTPKHLLKLPDIRDSFKKAIKLLNFQTLEGYLKGFIDLIYCHQHQFYVLDYKTNWLGPNDTFYTDDKLEDAIAHSHYYLQYWLYTLALHRYLKQAKPDYDYDRDIGGVRYLFLRGIESPTKGVFCDKPTKAFIEALDALMANQIQEVLA